MKIAVDFDGTCVDHLYPYVGADVPHCVETLKLLNFLGHQLILYTMRSGQYLDDALRWFEENEIELYGIQKDPEQHEWTGSSKCYANIYIDDAALGAPLIKIGHFNRQCVDWLKVQELLGIKLGSSKNHSRV